MSLAMTQMVVDDFSGGITDYILDAQPNQSQELENFLIDPNKKAISAPGSRIYDASMSRIPDGNQRVCSIFASQYPELLLNSARKVWYPSGTFTEFLGPTSNPVFSAGTTSDFMCASEWNEHIFLTTTAFSNPVKLYKDGSSVWQTRTAGMPDLATSPTVVSSGGSGNNYVYAFLYYYTYTVGTTIFEDYGPTTQVQLTNAGAPNTNTVNVTVIPTLANGATLNYDTTNVKVYVYRTIASGTVFYKVGQVNNGTATFNDTMSDATLINQLQLYTNSGVLDNDPPPLCKYVHMVNGVGYYAHIKVGSQIFKNRVRQSAQDDPDSCPEGNYIDVLDEITGFSSYNDNPLVFTKNHVYRLNGQYNELGQGQVSFEDITKTIGCVSNSSIVQTRFGVFWAGNDGFYWTDGFSFKKISDSINERYKDIVSTAARALRIDGKFDSVDNRVYWAVALDASSSDNDSFVVLDLRWGVRDASTFTTRNNGTSFSPTAIAFYGGQLIRGDRRGYVFKHDAQYTTDPLVDTAVAATAWSTKAIVPLYRSTAFNFGMPMVRKWVPKILLTLVNLSNASVQISSINDNSSGEVDLYEIRFRGNYIWGDPNPVWGDDTILWSFFNLIEEMRRFPAGSMRCSYKQISITQSDTNIYNSDNVGAAVADRSTKKATLTAPNVWPDDIVGYTIAFDNDDYTREYPITSRNSDTVITYTDGLSSSPNNISSKWVIRGQPKGEIINILSYVLYFSPMTDQSFKTFRLEQDPTGGNT